MRGSVVHLSTRPFWVQNSWIVKSSNELLINLRFPSPRNIYSHGDLDLVLAFLSVARSHGFCVHVCLCVFIISGCTHSCLWRPEVTLSCSSLGGVHSFCLETGSLTRTWGHCLVRAAGQWASGVCRFWFPGARTLGMYSHTQCFYGCEDWTQDPMLPCPALSDWSMFPSEMVVDAHSRFHSAPHRVWLPGILSPFCWTLTHYLCSWSGYY